MAKEMEGGNRQRREKAKEAREAHECIYVAAGEITGQARAFAAEKNIRLIGADYLSVARFDQAAETHRVLMAAGIAILEGLDLGEVAAGSYRLICTPLRIDNVEAAPARALLEPAS